MTINKKHWYDGWFYDKIIAPHQDRLFSKIKTLIGDNSQVIDVGCGTGRLAFTIADKCKSVTGIDLSKSNIKRADVTLAHNPDGRITFRHDSFSEIISEGGNHYDYAILTYVIHEVREDERIPLLKEIARITDSIIIGDYLIPGPKGPGGIMCEVIEFIAGREHFRNYRTYAANGGIRFLAESAGLQIKEEYILQSAHNHIVVLKKN